MCGSAENWRINASLICFGRSVLSNSSPSDTRGSEEVRILLFPSPSYKYNFVDKTTDVIIKIRVESTSVYGKWPVLRFTHKFFKMRLR